MSFGITTPEEEHDMEWAQMWNETEAQLKKVLLFHKPMEGEAYPDDPNHYCSICVHPNGTWAGRSYIYPCPTVKAIQKILEA